MRRPRPGAAVGRGSRERALRARSRANEPRRPAARVGRRLAAPPLRPRRRRPDCGPAVDASAFRRGGRRRRGLGPRRTRHEGRRGDDGHRVPAGEGRGPRASGRARARRGLRRGGRRGLRREVPGAGASRRARRRPPCARRGGRRLRLHGRPPLLPDPGGREAAVPHQGDGAWPGRPRGTADARWRDGAARSDAAGARPQAHAAARDAGGAGDSRGGRRRVAPREGGRAAGAARSAHPRRRRCG